MVRPAFASIARSLSSSQETPRPPLILISQLFRGCVAIALSTQSHCKQMSEFWTTGENEQQFSDGVAFPNLGKVGGTLAEALDITKFSDFGQPFKSRSDRATKSLPPLVVRSPYL
ncbi:MULTISPECIES: hypothetical protein [Trichocoleus]|uniref:Uncharacterized protein n=1 Tax=Trichocoleus desertorum GB2-A4 TaxID=2933944 RepID=A0ABV0JFD4_9CYAN|nr:hypothetical protein [Trichocoleus sp. FACHB-46]MBD1865201.1 hypothetical protein [Trichocoleus sp. FACHB-46]